MMMNKMIQEIAVCMCGKAFDDCELDLLGQHLVENASHKWVKMTREEYIRHVVSVGRICA